MTFAISAAWAAYPSVVAPTPIVAQPVPVPDLAPKPPRNEAPAPVPTMPDPPKPLPIAAPVPKPTAKIDRETPLYEDAHEAHFVARDPARALAAWDAYLVGYPSGRFAPEAKYNRALSLLRLGRKDEANEALAPFADGAHGEYRKREAKKLLDALR
jgi:TolA-binding protein